MDPQTTVMLSLIAAGTSLAGLGLLRLVASTPARMPVPVAVSTLVVGTAVAASSWLWPRVDSDPAASRRLPLSSAAPAPHTSQQSVISGRVTDASGKPVAGAAVLLQQFERTEESDKRSAVTRDDGRYRFEDLPYGPTTAYRVSTEHEGAKFGTDLVFLGPRKHEADLVVAPPTSDDKNVSLAVDSTVLVGDERAVQFLHVLRVENTGRTAYAGGLRLPLHPDAAGFTPERGLDRTRLAQARGSLVSLAPLVPGTTEIAYTYGVATRDGAVDIERQVHYPTERADVLLSGPFELRADGLGRAAGDVVLPQDDRSYQRFTRRNLETGDELSATVSRSEPFPAAARVGLVVAAVAAAAAVILFPLLRRRRSAAAVAAT